MLMTLLLLISGISLLAAVWGIKSFIDARGAFRPILWLPICIWVITWIFAFTWLGSQIGEGGFAVQGGWIGFGVIIGINVIALISIFANTLSHKSTNS